MATLRRCFNLGRASRKAFDERVDQLLFKPVCGGRVDEEPGFAFGSAACRAVETQQVTQDRPRWPPSPNGRKI
jgi:hypothetical protein